METTDKDYQAKSNFVAHTTSLKLKLRKEIQQIEKELPLLAQDRLNSLSDYSLFIAMNNAYNLALQRKALAERKLSNVCKSKHANGYMESYEITVQLPRIR